MLRDTLIVTFVDAIVSLICGVAVFSVLGNLAHEQVTFDRLINSQRWSFLLKKLNLLWFYLKEKDNISTL